MKQTYLFLLILVAALTSCNSGSFKIDGNITNLESNAVTVVFHGDSGIVEQQADVDKKGHFAFKGESPQPVIVYLLNHRYEVLAVAVVANGDHIKVKGDASKSMSFKVKGNRLNEDWQLFRDEHRAFYSDPNPSRLDAAIEKYVSLSFSFSGNFSFSFSFSLSFSLSSFLSFFFLGFLCL